ncbi:helicase domino isoform X5 [Venturia canescens]|uniref:helicase domino isoform X5 n=1 Tax=Venturia canescens TaxID=32260 RepID=UPI001C9CCAEA|nr:helicase domino isoform X5 [Venturia canescens]
MSDKQGAPNLPPLAGGGNNNGTSNPSTTQQTVSLQQVLATAQGLNVLTTGGGQQFVITSQVPGLTQVLSAGGTANATGLQQVGFPRIVNIGGGSQRVIGVASASGSPLSSPNRQTKVVLATSPKLVRTSLGNVFVTPTSQSSINSIVGQAGSTSPSPARKKLRLTETTEKITASDDSALVGNATTVGSATTTTTTTTTTTSTSYRRRIMEHKMKRMRAIREKYAENASELFFLHAGGNMMDFHNWKRRPPTPQYLLFLRQHRLDPEDDDEDLTVPLAPVNNPVNEIVLASCGAPTTIVVPGNPSHNTNPNFNNPTTPITQSNEIKITSIGATPVAVSTTLPAAVAQLSQQGGTPIIPEAPRPQPTETPIAVTTSSTSAVTFATTAANTTIACPNVEQFTVETPTSVTEMKNETTPSTTVVTTTTNVATTTASTPSPQPVVKLVKLPSASSNNLPISESQNNQEQIVEKAKQEAYVMQRIAELQRDGLWSERRLPKVQEPARTKAHWDYLLEEMVWLAADFAQERKWKKAAAKKCARMVQKHFQEKAIQAQKAEKSHELRLKKIAGFMAKEIKTFWTNVEKLVEFKQQTRLEEKRKKALDQHLNFIVGQTEKYSTWLTEGLNKTEGNPSMPVSINSSRISSPVPTSKQHSDDEFEPNQSSEDDEETIAKAEEEMQSVTNHKEEVELLKKESEIPLEDLIKELPPNYLEERDKSLSPSPKESAEEGNDSVVDGDAEFTVASDESSDDENTIMEQEKLEGNTNHQKELDDLKAENEMSIDELMAKYGNMADTSMDVDVESDHESAGDSDKDEMDQQDEKSESESESEDETKEDEEDSQTQSDGETDVGLKSLLEDLSSDNKPDDKNKSGDGEQCENHNEMDDVAALAESIQPKGNTLLTTSVVTKIPFLLKHSLREYQHIGLDWLVTMYERKLNGILADEMGLGKTIQTIALLAHLACEKGNWGPHLIIVPTSVMLNWEMECKKWCPGFKILTYYGTQKERKQKRTGWTKPNAFHICITSYKLVIQDHQSFRRKKWKYLILDEAQNIKNFKSQRWQLLLNFQTQRRLLLTGTPLQNNLMELWSLMHFLMPNVFQSHREFKEWFSNPVTGMIEGNSEYNENIIRRLHKVLRPFLLRRLKTEVEKQLPKKYEHVVMCRLSKRQRYLYDDFMSRAKTKETLASGNLLSVINVLMQLRKVCNHPNLFEVRPTVSPFQMDAIEFVTASLAWSALDYNPFKSVDLAAVNLLLINLEFTTTAFVAHRVKRLKTPRKLIEEIDSLPEPPPRCPSGKIKINVRLSNQTKAPVAPPPPTTPKVKNFTGIVQNPRTPNSPLIKTINNQASPGQGVTLRVAGGQQLQGYSVQLVQHQGSVKAFPVATLAHNPTGSSSTTTTSPGSLNTQRITVGNANIRDGLQRLTTQTVTVKQGDSVQRIAVPSFAQLVQTSTGRHIILTSNQQNTNTGEFVSFPVMTSSGPRLTVLSKSLMGLSTATKVVGSVVTTTTNAGGRLGMRVPSLNVNTSPIQVATALQQQQPQQQQSLRCGIVTRSAQKEPVKVQPKEEPKSEFHIPQLEEERRKRRQSKLQSIADVNERRCAACPLYGEDLFTALRIEKPATVCQWHNGSLHCKNAKETARTRKQFFSRTEALAAAIKSTEEIVEELKDVFQRFVVYVPAVRAPTPRFHVSHPSPHKFWSQQRVRLALETEFSRKMEIVHPVASAMMTQFPDPRLIQYDCGKLQSLDRLLRNLKADNHRVLIFTQMTRMLDVLEAFLNFHGHIYLRLDGTTKVDQRQVLMERFNGDKRIFCFILSTRSGGVGVNLTGADTVIFYDSDWNPTMDAQAQDRCHRIGQTRDVHIYRLVSDRTVEENILKKANQKRLLGDLAIEGGNFTTAYFKSSTIQDLFNVDQTENDASTRMADVLDQNRDRDKALHREATVASASSQPTEEKVAIGALESALAAAEEELDVQAAKTAKAEAVADLAEFDENIPLDETERDDPQFSKAEQEVQNLVSQLTPVERYAMKFVEEAEGSFSAAQLAAAERELEQQKKEWELDRLRALREEEERRLRLADDDEKPLTFGREDAQNQIWLSESTMEQMPMWCPPTPPTSDNDVYVDYSLGFLYDSTPMSEAQLPPIYVKKEQKRSRVEVSDGTRDGRRPIKMRHKEESVYAPRSLFDRPSPALIKMRRDIKLHKYRPMVRPPMSISGVKPSTMLRTSSDQEHVLDWMVHEDWSLLQAIQVYQGLPLNLVILSPGHTPNWDLVADIVNNTSRIYRSPKQCRTRYETVIVPREEGKLLYDTTPKKQKKQKGVYKLPQVAEQQSKTNRPMRTSQLYNQDKNNSFTLMCCQRFDTIKSVSNKRPQPTKSLLVNPLLKNPKHAEVLAESGIQYDGPLAPIEVATRRAERIAKEKLKNVVTVLASSAAASSSTAATAEQQQQQQQQQIHIVQQAQNAQTQQQQIVATTTPQSHQLTQIVATVATPTNLKSAAVTNTIATSATSIVTATVKASRAIGGTLTMQDSRSTPTVVGVANLQAAQRLATANLVAGAQTATGVVTQKGIVGVTMATASGSKTLTPGQLQYYRHQQVLRQHNIKLLQQAQAGQGQKVSVAVSAATGTQVRANLMKQSVAVGTVTQAAGGTVTKQNLARAVTESEMATLLKRQAAAAAAAAAQHQSQTKVGQVQVAGQQTGLTPAQIFAQAGLQVQQASTSTGAGTPVATLVKTANVSGVRAATPQQIRQLALHPQILTQRKMAGQKVAQLAQVKAGGVQTQLIVQQKSLPAAMTVQQIQQVMKHVQPSGIQQFTHVSTGQAVSQAGQVVLAKSALQTRVIPVAQSGLKQTIQVVTASTAQLRQATPAQGKPIVTTARASPGPSQVRLQTIAHSVHQQQAQQHQQQQQQQQQQNQQDSQPK